MVELIGCGRVWGCDGGFFIFVEQVVGEGDKVVWDGGVGGEEAQVSDDWD